jgi:hypothetical protein
MLPSRRYIYLLAHVMYQIPFRCKSEAIIYFNKSMLYNVALPWDATMFPAQIKNLNFRNGNAHVSILVSSTRRELSILNPDSESGWRHSVFALGEVTMV